MAKEKKTRVIRSKEEIKAELDKKIEYHQACIRNLQEKKTAIETGRRAGTRKKTIKRLINDAKLTDTELLEVMTMGDEEKIRERLNEIIEEKNKKK